MRLTHFALLTLAGCLTVSAAGPKDVTYLKGSLEGISPDKGSTLDLTNTKVMVLRSGEAKFEIPYLAVTKSDRKTQVVLDEKEPVYKVWNLRKKLLPPTPLEQISFDYKDAKGAMKSVTLEMDPSIADKLSARLAKADERKAVLRGEWWGDSVWKTKRNETAWSGAEQPTQAGAIAQRE